MENFRQPLERARFEKSHLKSEIRIMEARLIGPFAPSHAFASASCSSGPSHGHSSPANRFETPMGAIIVPSHQVRGPEGPPTEETSLVPASLPTLSRSNQRKEKERRGYVETKDTNIYTCIYIYIMHTNFDISRPRDLHAADLKPLKRISSGDLFLARSTCRASSRPRRAETGGGGGGGGRVPTYEDRDPPRKHRMEAGIRGRNKDTRCTPPDNEQSKHSRAAPASHSARFSSPLSLSDLPTDGCETQFKFTAPFSSTFHTG